MTGKHQTGLIDLSGVKEMVMLDDNDMFVTAFEHAADCFDTKVHGYTSPQALLKEVDRFPKDIIFFIDMYMPHCTGIEVAEKLHAKGFQRLFLLTGAERDDIREEIPQFIEDVLLKGPDIIKCFGSKR